MCGFSKKRFSAHKAASVAVVLLYMLVVSTISLFHNDGCELTRSDAANKDVIPRNDQCPACRFLAGHSSTGANYGPALVSAECPLISQFLPHLAVVHCDEWAYSITPRAPPSTSIS
jgi:hypothetical protein